jgi:hypothetical protein
MLFGQITGRVLYVLDNINIDFLTLRSGLASDRLIIFNLCLRSFPLPRLIPLRWLACGTEQ